MVNSFGEFFKQKRLDNHLTQKELANMLYVSESAVSKWEKDIAHPDITLLPKISEILGVSEHELITASIDKQTREDKKHAKKWRVLSFTWDMFFYISYLITILTCFIVNLAVSGRLDWFWIVLSSLVLSFSFINLPKLIKKHKLILLPLSMFMSLVLLLFVCVLYTSGDWFWVAAFSVLFGLLIVFTPIYISKYKVFDKIKKYNDFISFAFYFVLLNILLIIVDFYCVTNGYSKAHWYLNIGFPISLYIYAVLNVFLSVRFLKINNLFKTGIILSLFNIFVYSIPFFVKVQNINIQKEIDDLNILKANFSNWNVEYIDKNVHCIIFFTFLFLSVVFLLYGLIKHLKTKNKIKENNK